MTETILRDGEVAFTSNGDVIMNVNTMLELDEKLKAKNTPAAKEPAKKEEQDPAEALEKVALLLALMFGPEILDKKPVKVAKPAAPAVEEGVHPKFGEKYFFPDEVKIFDHPSSRNTLVNSPFVYVDNYGNIFGTLSEVDWRHGMSDGSAARIVKGEQAIGWGRGYSPYMPAKYRNLQNNVFDYKRLAVGLYAGDSEKIKNGTWARKNMTQFDKDYFEHKHLVNVVRVPKCEILPWAGPTGENTRQQRYLTWVKAMMTAENELIQKVRSKRNKLLNATTDKEFKAIIDSFPTSDYLPDELLS